MPVVTITATGLDTAITPNNFTVSIIDWDDIITTYATGVTRTALISGYNVTVNPGDVTIKVTSTGLCTSFTTVDVSNLALQSYRPDPVQGTTSSEYPDSLPLESSGEEYIIGDTFIYPFMNDSDFTLEHVSTTGASGLPATGGPFVPPTLEARVDPNNNTTLFLIGYLRPSYSTDSSTNSSIYRVTYTPSGLSRTFTYYWVVNI
jgi:hypothetical protein